MYDYTNINEISYIDYNEIDNTILTASYDKTIKKLNGETGELINSINYRNPNYPSACATKVICGKSNNQIFTASIDGQIINWDIEKDVIIGKLVGHTADVTDIALNKSKTKLISCSSDSTIKEWDINTYKLLKSIDSYSGILLSICYSDDESKILVASHNGYIKELDTKTWALSKPKYQSPIEKDGLIWSYCISIPDYKELQSPKSKPIEIAKAMYNYYCTKIFCQLDFGSIIINDKKTNKIKQIEGIWRRMDYDRDNEILFMVDGIKGKVIQYDILNSAIIREYIGSAEKCATCIKCVKDKLIASYINCNNGEVGLSEWNTKTGELIF